MTSMYEMHAQSHHRCDIYNSCDSYILCIYYVYYLFACNYYDPTKRYCKY